MFLCCCRHRLCAAVGRSIYWLIGYSSGLKAFFVAMENSVERQLLETDLLPIRDALVKKLQLSKIEL
jgi:hypothetical protein